MYKYTNKQTNFLIYKDKTEIMRRRNVKSVVKDVTDGNRFGILFRFQNTAFYIS